MTTDLPTPTVVVVGGALGVADGLLMLLREAADPLPAGSVVAVRTTHPTVGHDLPAWCRIMSHTYLGADGSAYYLRKGDVRPPAAEKPDWGVRVPLRPGGEFHTRDWLVGRVGEVPEHATGATGFAPRGAVVEPGSPTYDFPINDRAAVWAGEVADLYEQATANQWDASRDIPWAELKPLPEPLERAVCQLMTFLAENEYSALYVPAKFVPRINPQFAEVVFFLCTQMADEARHIEAFTKRALANGGGLQYAAASTQRPPGPYRCRKSRFGTWPRSTSSGNTSMNPSSIGGPGARQSAGNGRRQTATTTAGARKRPAAFVVTAGDGSWAAGSH